MVILIPAYEPGERLIDLLTAIDEALPWQRVVIVDDGSGPDYASVFQRASRLGASVLHYPGSGRERNRGKGHALKFGFAAINEAFPGEAVVTADCDGQHTAADIERVADALDSGTAPLVLGSRAFTGDVPTRSRFGNAVTRLVFAAATRSRIGDTQTGLRAFAPELHPWLQGVEGDRFEYELNMLLLAKRDGIEILEVPIETIYLDQNESSHFRPLIDSARIYWPIVKFSVSSITAFVVDFTLLFVLMGLTGNLALSVAGARLVSDTVNFTMNRRFVFEAATSGPWGSAALRYGSLVAALLSANYALLRTLTGAGMGLVVAKLLTEATLFTVAYQVQKRVVFQPEHEPASEPATVD